ncbi:MAG: hypothetical protein IT537_24605 [Hyphomicrobiales bacterium]|nr:hypothetical protein [Hyphomicrobiales bacterium]
MTDDKLQAAIARGARAQELVRNELLAEAFAKLEADYVMAWKSWAAADTDGRERLWMAVNVLGKVRDHLVTMVTDGKLAQRQLQDLIGGKAAA